MPRFYAKTEIARALNNFPRVQRNALVMALGDPERLTVGAAGTNVTAVEKVNGSIRQTTLTLTAVAQAVVNGTEYQSSKIYDFPLGVITVLSCNFTIAQTTTSVIADTLNSGAVGAISLGSAAATNTTLSGAMVNVAPSTAFASSATINVAGTAVSNTISTPASLNGSATAADLYLNTAYATTGEVDADATQTLSGTVTFTWTVQ